MKFKTLSLFIFTILLVVACEKSEDLTLAKDLDRSLFIYDKTEKEILEEYEDLSDEQKMELWKDKIAQILSQPIPPTHINLIIQLQVELNKYSKLNEKVMLDSSVKEAAINIAKVIPENDFVMMFSRLDDYKYSGFNPNANICRSCILDLAQMPEQNQYLSLRSDKKLCNCKWSCEALETIYGGDTKDDCKETKMGCGFLWLFKCTKRYTEFGLE